MSTDIAEYDPEVAAEQPQEITTRTANDYRVESIGRALDAAYGKASTLTLSKDEAALLAADFPDEAFRLGAGGDDDLIYIEHAYLRKRLNEVLGVGAAVPIRRREWAEHGTYWGKDRKEHALVRVYVDLVLLVRGCVVGEAIGDAVYYPENAKTNYSDALESAKSNAFRRCCKEFGVGLQAWIKGWGDGWKERNRNGRPKTKQPPVASTAFAPPKDWPETSIDDLKSWIDGFSTTAQFKAALGMFLNEPSIVGIVSDWEPVLRHFAEAYKKKYQSVGTKELNDVIKAALDKMELDKQADELLNRDATQEAPDEQVSTSIAN